VGFWHEQSRPDRDLYVTIHEENITDGKLYNFQTRTWGEVVELNVPYDLGSGMHYGAKVKRMLRNKPVDYQSFNQSSSPSINQSVSHSVSQSINQSIYLSFVASHYSIV
jgi:Astacin (Peptidase family M12A)